MGGRSLLVYGKYLGDGAISYVGTMGWEGMIVSGVYLILDEATDGFWIDYSVPTQQNALTDD